MRGALAHGMVLAATSSGCALIAGLEDRVVGDAGACGAYEQAVLQDHPRSYWRLGDKKDQQTALDRVGKIEGTAFGAVTFGVHGALVDDQDTAVMLSKESAYIELGNAYDFDGVDAFSLEAWVHLTDNLKGWPRIVGRGNTTSEGYELLFRPIMQGDPNPYEPDGLLLLHRLPTAQSADISTELSLEAFRYVVATYDGKDARLYVDGELKATVSSPNPVAATAAPLRIGASYDAGNRFIGVIDEVAIYDYPLATERVQAHYCAGAKR